MTVVPRIGSKRTYKSKQANKSIGVAERVQLFVCFQPLPGFFVRVPPFVSDLNTQSLDENVSLGACYRSNRQAEP